MVSTTQLRCRWARLMARQIHNVDSNCFIKTHRNFVTSSKYVLMVLLSAHLPCLPAPEHGASPRTYTSKGQGPEAQERLTQQCSCTSSTDILWKEMGIPAKFTGSSPTGGYETFYSQYPECCVDVKPVPQEKIESERGILSQCGKPVLSVTCRPAYDQGGPVEILPFLYLGSAYHASKCEFLANLHITALLNVSRRTSEACATHLHYKWIPVEDSHTADISSHFQEAIDFIDCVREGGGKVLVHCEAGVSRSPTICMAYLMKTKQFRLKEAFDYVKQRRSVISPNFGFMGQLLQYESEILPSTPTPQPPSCQGEAASPTFTDHLQTLSPDTQAPYCTFTTSVLAPVPTRPTVAEFHRSPVATATSC
ncbi:dual specificity protein phosphatase 5-like protein [Cricetulus griseus]|nr:dual specificity protein phosphatase 5-like protein [Cricetulus griseus]